MKCSPPGSLSLGILQARILEWVAMPSSRGSSQPRDWTWVSRIAGRFFTSWDTREAQEYWVGSLSLLQGIFPIQGLNWGLLHYRWILYQLSYFLVLKFYCSIIILYIIWKSLCYMVLYIHFPHDASLPGIFYPSPPLESWETYVHSSQFAHGKWLILFPTSLSPKSDEPLILLYSYLCYIFQSSTHHMELLFVRMCILSFL